MTEQLSFESKLAEMSRQQDIAATMIAAAAGDIMLTAKLCGGTALTRFHFQHRLSYDLDFFVPEGFDSQALINRLAGSVPMSNLEITHDPIKADQLHFTLMVADAPVKVSFIEDMYDDLFPLIDSNLVVGGVAIKTEPVEGLYHRKLRTVVGWADVDATQPAGGRQTARDMFDLYVLSKSHLPIRTMIEQLPYAFATTAFEDGIANMPWYDLMHELSETVAAPRWIEGKNVEVLRNHLLAEIGMTDIADQSDVAPPGIKD
jgi:Nucleotidyl transferase AbiEii toxin, Type IV TA system